MLKYLQHQRCQFKQHLYETNANISDLSTLKEAFGPPSKQVFALGLCLILVSSAATILFNMPRANLRKRVAPIFYY